VAGLQLASSRRSGDRALSLSHRLAGHLAALSWLAGVLAPLPSGWSWLMLAWADYALLLHWLARRELPAGPEPPATFLAHGLFAVTGAWFLGELWRGATLGLAQLNVPTYADLAILLMAFAASFLLATRPERLVYRFAVHAAVLIWLWRELIVLPNGNGYATLAWGVYGLALLLFGLRRDFNQLVIWTALGTLALVIGKLLLVDMGAVETIWRILLFIGFGGAFLVVSYYVQNLIRRGPTHGGKPA
jgi:hypothetical protein